MLRRHLPAALIGGTSLLQGGIAAVNAATSSERPLPWLREFFCWPIAASPEGVKAAFPEAAVICGAEIVADALDGLSHEEIEDHILYPIFEQVGCVLDFDTGKASLATIERRGDRIDIALWRLCPPAHARSEPEAA